MNNKIENTVEFIKQYLNYTHSSFSATGIEIKGNVFVFFNDYHQCVELHTNQLHFYDYKFDNNTIIARILYSALANQAIKIEYLANSGKNKLWKITLGFHTPQYEFTVGNKMTSHGKSGHFDIIKYFERRDKLIASQLEDNGGNAFPAKILK